MTVRHSTRSISSRKFIPIIGRSLSYSNTAHIRLLEGVCSKKNNKKFLVTTMRVLVEATFLPQG